MPFVPDPVPFAPPVPVKGRFVPNEGTSEAEPATFGDRLGAVMPGIKAGVAGIAGMPVDTMTKVMDLGKAALGTGYTSLTGKAAPKALQPYTESDGITVPASVVGSTEWIREYLDKNKITNTQIPRPDDAPSRYIAAAASAVPSVLGGKWTGAVPKLANAVEAALIGTGVQAVGEAGGSPALQQAAGALASTVRPAVHALEGAPDPLVAPKVKKVTGNMTPEQAHNTKIETLLANDVPVDKRQRGGTGSSLAGSLDRGSTALIGESGFVQKQARAFTKAVLKKVGLDAELATSDQMQKLHNNVSGEYESLHATPTKLDTQTMADLDAFLDDIGSETTDAAIAGKYVKAVENLRKGAVPDPEFKAQLDRYAQPTGNDGYMGRPWPKGPAPKGTYELSGDLMQDMRNRLGRWEGGQSASDKYLAGRLKDILDDAYERNAPPGEAARMKEVRKQFHWMKQIEDSVAGRGDGIITPKKLQQVLGKKRNRNEKVYEAGDQSLVDLAEAGATILPEKIGDSGSATRGLDVAKWVAVATEPVMATKVGATLLGGRVYNQSGSMKGSASDVAKENIKRATVTQEGRKPNLVAGQITTAESPEERKRRLRAEQLRK